MPVNFLGRGRSLRFDDVAELPRVTPTLPAVPTINTGAGDTTRTASTLAGLNSALTTVNGLDGNRNHEIVLAAGSNINVPTTIFPPAKTGANPAGSGWIIIRSDGTLPAAGTTVQPSDAAQLAKLTVTGETQRVFQFDDNGAHHYWWMGLELTLDPSLTNIAYLMLIGKSGGLGSPQTSNMHHFIVDRCYIHGNVGQKLRNGIAWNAGEMIVTDSWISEVHEVGGESHGFIGWNTPGPLLFQHNHVEAASSGFFIGGADADTVGKVPSDMTIRKNRFVKPAIWYTPVDRTYNVKNMFELKAGQRVLIEDNIFDTTWMGFGQVYALNFKANNQDGTAYWQRTENVTFRFNKVFSAAAGLVFSSESGQPPTSGLQLFSVHDNVLYDIGTDVRGNNNGTMISFAEKPHDISIFNNTFVPNNTGASTTLILMDARPYAGGAGYNFKFQDNIAYKVNAGVKWSESGTGGVGKTALNGFWGTGLWTFDGNIIVGTAYTSTDALPGNTWVANEAAIGFTNAAGKDFSLAGGSVALTSGHAGGRSGADIATLNTRLSSVAL